MKTISKILTMMAITLGVITVSAQQNASQVAGRASQKEVKQHSAPVSKQTTKTAVVKAESPKATAKKKEVNTKTSATSNSAEKKGLAKNHAAKNATAMNTPKATAASVQKKANSTSTHHVVKAHEAKPAAPAKKG